jgi:hypothetical protein
MSHKFLNLLREIRPNAIWDFIKLGVVAMLASGLGLIYWLVQEYREAPFSVIVMIGIFFVSFAFTFVLFGYQKLKEKQPTEKQWYETPENDLISKSPEKDLVPKQLETKEKIQPVPILLIHKSEVPISIPNSRNLVKIISDGSKADAVVFAVEVHFKPSIDVSGTVEVEAHLQIDKNPRNKGLWLKSKKQTVRLSVGESDYLILAVQRFTKFYQYKIIQERIGGRIIQSGAFSQLPPDLMFEVEIVAKQSGKVVLTGIARLRLFDANLVKFGKIEVGEEAIFFGFTTDSAIHDGLMSLKPKL